MYANRTKGVFHGARTMLTRSLLLFMLLAMPAISEAAVPAILYSDLDSGPNAGGENNKGVFVTIWGKNFGATRGTSFVTVGGGQADNYPFWSDTKIVFQLGASATTGNIAITTGEGQGTSNIPFTVRAGTVYFVAANGSGNGLSVSSPMSPSAAYNAMGPGKTFYFRAGTYNQNYSGGGVYGYTNYTLGQSRGGTQGLPMAMVGYPNETVVFRTPDSTRGNIRLDGNEAPANYVTIANFTMMGGADNINGGGITVAYGEVANSGGLGLRVVGNIFSASYTWNTMTGLVTVRNNGARILGNEFKDTGTTPPINNNHAIYVQLGSSDVEIGWNYLRNLRMGHVIQVHTDKSFTYTNVRIHDNVITAANNNDSRGINVGIAQPGTYGAIYNNILYNVGQNFSGIAMYSGNWKVYNNTLYNIYSTSGMVWIQYDSATADVRNNIFYSDGNSPYVGAFNGATMSQMTLSNNLYYNRGAAPSQDSSPVTGNPLFINPLTGDFRLQTGSPAKDGGTATAVNTVVTIDNDGTSRPQGLAYDIGAYESSGPSLPKPQNLTIYRQ